MGPASCTEVVWSLAITSHKSVMLGGAGILSRACRIQNRRMPIVIATVRRVGLDAGLDTCVTLSSTKASAGRRRTLAVWPRIQKLCSDLHPYSQAKASNLLKSRVSAGSHRAGYRSRVGSIAASNAGGRTNCR
jgi:hypothetical protein